MRIAERLSAARKTLEAVESAEYPKKLSGTLVAEPIENYVGCYSAAALKSGTVPI